MVGTSHLRALALLSALAALLVLAAPSFAREKDARVFEDWKAFYSETLEKTVVAQTGSRDGCMLLSIVVRSTTETLWESSRMSLRSLVPVTTTCSIRSFHAAPEVSAASYSAVCIVESFSSACTDSASGTAAIAAAMHLKQYVIISSFCRFDELF